MQVTVTLKTYGEVNLFREASINISCHDASLRIKYAVSPLVSLSKKASYKEVAISHNVIAFVLVLVNVRQKSVIFLNLFTVQKETGRIE